MKQVSIFKGVVSLEKVLAFCLIFIYLVGCAQTDPNTKGPSNENSNEQISISIQEDTLTNKGATIELKNESEEAVIFTSFYVIEKEKNGNWEELPYVIEESIVGWEDIAYPVGGEYEEVMELAIDWGWLYGELEEGSYKISKDYFLFDDSTKESLISTEFTIE